MFELKNESKLKAYIEILRPGWWLACFLIGFTPGVLAIFYVNGSLNELLQIKTLIWTLGYWSSVVGIYVFNDYVGLGEDKIVNPKRPLPSKRITENGAVGYSIVLLAIGLTLWWIAFTNVYSSLIQIACIGIMVVYSAKYKNNILLGLAAGLIPVGVWIALAPFNSITIALFLIVFFWELSLDVPENILHYEGDVKYHPHTFAASIGREKFARIGLIFPIPAVIATFWLFSLLDMSIVFLIFALIASIALLSGINSIRENLAPMMLGRALGMTMFFILLVNIGTISHTIVYTFY
jgi:4-hydroxybenzoate polyprenyltransferase